jgi:glycosyltransferase involved in cell wall biosynthesis
VLDCGSTDGTAEIARAHGAQVYRAEHTPNLNVNKNRCIALARQEWVLLLDADEVVGEALAREIRTVVARNPRENGFWIPRRNWYFGHLVRYGGQYPDYQLRLFRRGTLRFPEQHIHEYPLLRGTAGRLREALDHFPYETLSHYLAKMDRDTEFHAQYLLRRYGRAHLGRLLRLVLLRPAWRFLERYLLWQGFRDGFAGFLCAWLDGVNSIVAAAKYWQVSEQMGSEHVLSEANRDVRGVAP